MKQPSQPIFRDLTEEEVDRLLRRNVVGRIAFVVDRHVDIQPIHYAYDAPWIYIRTSHGTKIEAIAHNRWVAFEVDEVKGTLDWQSVVIHGAAYPLHPDMANPGEYNHAVELLRRVVPQTMSEDDPVPERDLFLRIYMDQVRGRIASTSE
jgi:uncharacterized protein